ncbi:MAG: lysophospholipid acyltransferase family protein [Smithellaceae bacterium]|mgnify:CR=1 FL=1|nr:lysophospholipid acyltransferase family protein [Smithellaceae bacterium]MDD3258377.1 lysophospholipid acyltransferase family protein [Smithellaceae bacterium]MDD3849106.1 lysophospholipid acyltransferase family protein [Smithellaceae bacterium]HOQ72530.1 lysophospholipid acyltransferase family protein [Smithellaceae bacterium]HPL10094.1 lysophospholipid acyltransferase family protein [Smithellaceae bacterium]
MNKILRILYQPYKWLIFAPYLAVSTLFFGSLTVVLAVVTNPRITSFICGTIWARLNGYLTPIRVKVTGRENIDQTQSYVIVANHQSQYDIFVLYGWLGIDFKWVMKQELRKVPGIGIGCEKVGHIFIDRSNHEKALASLRAAKEKIVNGTSVIFFPEGTRSRDGSLGVFKKGAFKMAVDLRLPILPITIVGTRDILPTDSVDLFPGRARMIIHKPIDTGGYKDDNLDELVDRARGIIGSGLWKGTPE